MDHTPELFLAAHRKLQLIRDPNRQGEDPTRPETVQAMPIVLHLPKGQLPDRTALLEAAAQAVVAVCLDDRAGEDSAYAVALEKWYGARIRKIARRARNVHWDRVQLLPGVTVDWRGAQARAFLPSAVADTDPLLAKLQISGADLPLSAPKEANPETPLILIDAGLTMSVGKAAAQVGHASMLLAAAMSSEKALEWAMHNFALQVREVPTTEFDFWASREGAVLVQDAGYTEVAPGSTTAVAIEKACLSTKN